MKKQVMMLIDLFSNYYELLPWQHPLLFGEDVFLNFHQTIASVNSNII